MVFDDRRALTALVSDGDVFVRMLSEIRTNNVVLTRSPLSELGDRLALHYLHWQGPASNLADGTGEFELDFLGVHEVDESGLVTDIVVFDAEDRLAANDELWRRYDESDEGQERAVIYSQARRAFNHHDLPGLRECLHDDFVFEDRRRTSIGFLRADDYVDSVGALIEVSRSFLNESVYMIAVEPWGSMDLSRIVGTTKDGAPFENLFVRATSTDGNKLTTIAIFEPEQMDRAVERFRQFGPPSVDVPSNNATRTLDQAQQLLEAQDWDALEALASPDLVFEDRRSQVLVDADRDGWLRSSKFMASANAAEHRTVLSVLGDRLALYSSVWHADVDGALIEVETLGLAEVDADGRLRSLGSLRPR